ncbi:MAG: Replicative DNA helicase [candidate division BRC1 bacterium ADurb.BinA364]|nr:MAG: Replicative DNA helicase [candidate division BRC1 bacterium ADurb.BinA364]
MSDSPIDSGGILPHNLDAERAALGVALLDPGAVSSLQDLLRPDDFFSTSHRKIFEAMSAMADENRPIDPATLADRLERGGELELVGGPAYIATLEEYVFDISNLGEYARTIKEKARLRRLILAARQIQDEAVSSPRPIQEILDSAEKLVFELTQERQSTDFLHVSQVAVDAMDQIHARFHNRQEVSGTPTGYRDLDLLLTGFHPSQLIILAARPSVGKTAFALNIASNVVLKASIPVGFFSLEMSNQEVFQRLLCAQARVPLQKIRRGMINRADLEKLDQHARILSDAPLLLDDTPGLSILELRSKARRMKAEYADLGMIVVDYLQLMHSGGRIESRQQEVAEIARSLKALSRELEVPVVALSQLSRGIEQRKGKDKTPKLSDLRESGAIEQDADVVLFVHREHTLDRADDNGGAAQRPLSTTPAEIIVGKQRNGPVGTVNLLFLGEFTRFESIHHDAGF